MSVDPNFAHWGIAAFVFSLDLSTPLAQYALPKVPFDTIKLACRHAIMQNREGAEQGHTPLYLRDAIYAAVPPAQIAGAARFFDWIDQDFISLAKPRLTPPALLAPLRDMALMARVDAALQETHGTDQSYGAMIHSAIAPQIAQTLADLVAQADHTTDLAEFSDWDNDIITRNAQVHSVDNPLAPLIMTLTQTLQRHAAEDVGAELGPQAVQQIETLVQAA